MLYLLQLSCTTVVFKQDFYAPLWLHPLQCRHKCMQHSKKAMSGKYAPVVLPEDVEDKHEFMLEAYRGRNRKNSFG